MKVSGFLWIDVFVEKLDRKHGVATDEVEAIFSRKPFVTRIERGRVQGEDVYRALGQTVEGRYLVVFFVLKQGESCVGNQCARYGANGTERI